MKFPDKGQVHSFHLHSFQKEIDPENPNVFSNSQGAC